ncbi:MAG: hypothetical protein ABSG43_09475 [Solirubrobacteraceae bacterium]|jgi:hypothetical protein
MPTFCRHNRLVQNCPICSREQSIALRPIVTSSAPRASVAAPRTPAPGAGAPRATGAGRTGIRVRRLARGADDGYRSRLAPGLKSSEDAERLAEELAFAAGRLRVLEQHPPGLYAQVAAADSDIEERTWLAFLLAYLCPVDGEDPFAPARAAWVSWSSGAEPLLDGVQTGPRTAHEPDRAAATIDAYRAWAQRAGSQAAAFGGEDAWTPERRFARVFERLALPGFHRDARFDLLVTLGRLRVYELRAGSLQIGGANEPTLAAKRILGIGDSLLLERRASELAQACELPLEALDLGFYNWGRGKRATLGLGPSAQPDPDALASIRAGLGLPGEAE